MPLIILVKLKYGVIVNGPMSATGWNELIAAFEFKYEAQKWLKERFPSRKQRAEHSIVPIDPDALVQPLIVNGYPQPTGEPLRVDTSKPI